MKNIKNFTLALITIFTIESKNFYSFENPKQKKVNNSNINNTNDEKQLLINELADL